MIGGIFITYTGAVPRGMKRALGKMKKASFGVIGEVWHRRFRPKHFTRRGATEYGYTPRKGERGSQSGKRFKNSYTGRKLRLKGHTRPLEYTGQSKALTRIKDVRATAKGNRIVLHSPGFNRRSSFSTINMRKEMTTVSIKEGNQLAKRFEKSVQQQLDRYSAVEKKTFTF